MRTKTLYLLVSAGICIDPLSFAIESIENKNAFIFESTENQNPSVLESTENQNPFNLNFDDQNIVKQERSKPTEKNNVNQANPASAKKKNVKNSNSTSTSKKMKVKRSNTTFTEEMNTIEYRREPANGWVWGGGGIFYAPEELTNYISHPTFNYQLGVAKSFYNFNPRQFFYFGFIFDIGFSRKHSCGSTVSFTSLNQQGLLGYESTLGTKYLSGFLEVGPVMQERSFVIQNNGQGDAIFGTRVGVTTNAGFNIKIVPDDRVSYVFRFAMNFMYGQKIIKTLECACSGETLNVNPMSYGPSVSFGVRL